MTTRTWRSSPIRARRSRSWSRRATRAAHTTATTMTTLTPAYVSPLCVAHPCQTHFVVPKQSEYDEEGSVASLDLNAKDQPSRSSSQRPGHSSHHRSNSSSHRPSSSSHSRHHSTSNSRPGSRSGSPSGSALVAKRATSPTGSTSGRSKSAPGSRNASPGPSGGGGKRKRTEGEDADAAKRRKNGGGGTPPPSSGELITEADLVALFKTRPSFTLTTKDVLAHFKKALKADPRNKAAIGGMLQSVANLVGKELVLKAGY
jgi:transcription initiation factor TFIIF subunit alpha